MQRYEVCCPISGATIISTRFALVARVMARLLGHDWIEEGQGWLPGHDTSELDFSS